MLLRLGIVFRKPITIKTFKKRIEIYTLLDKIKIKLPII